MGRTEHKMRKQNAVPLTQFTRWTSLASAIVAVFAITGTALAQNVAPLSNNPTRQGIVQQAQQTPPGQNQGVYSDPLAPFNETMFSFNLKLDDWVLKPVATGYAAITPKVVRQSVERFFDNVNVIPRFTNNLFQLRLPEAGTEVARFGINTTLGVAGFFDPADAWFGLKEHQDDFGLTLRYYGVPAGAYLMLPLLGPSTVTDTVGIAVDAAMNPISYLTYMTDVGWWVPFTISAGTRLVRGVNYRAEHLDQFEEADRFAVDLYGAVQDAYLQTREARVKELKQ
jgi:phospholipid-binding lipoprotein MlaA